MKNATRSTVAAALAVALAGMGLPVAAFAANSADNAAESAVSAAYVDTSEGVDFVVDDLYGTWLPNAKLSDINGKWFSLNEKDAGEADSSVCYKIVIKDGVMDCYLGGTGAAGDGFPIPYEYTEKYGDTGTLYVGAG
ncbi:MAG: hypothetical protein ACI36Y_00460 [Coriobacteriales bacterium]